MGIKFIGRYIPGGRIKITRAGTAPQFTVQPSVTHADNYSDSTYTAVDGTVTPSSAAITRRWLLNGVSIGTGRTVIPGAAGSLVLEVTATNALGHVTATTTPLTITVKAPVFTVLPSISPNGGPMGTTFTGSNGTVSNATTITGQWILNGIPINGQTASTYVSDGTGSLTYKVTAVGAGGTVSATSNPVTISAGQVIQHAPTWVTQPGLLGTFAEDTSVSIPVTAQDQENNIATYAITGGQLPNGVSIDMFSGLISGVLGEVTQDSVYNFQVTVTDRTGLTLTGNFTINVANVKTTVVWNTDNSQALAMPAPGQPVNIQLGATSS